MVVRNERAEQTSWTMVKTNTQWLRKSLKIATKHIPDSHIYAYYHHFFLSLRKTNDEFFFVHIFKFFLSWGEFIAFDRAALERKLHGRYAIISVEKIFSRSLSLIFVDSSILPFDASEAYFFTFEKYIFFRFVFSFHSFGDDHCPLSDESKSSSIGKRREEKLERNPRCRRHCVFVDVDVFRLEGFALSLFLLFRAFINLFSMLCRSVVRRFFLVIFKNIRSNLYTPWISFKFQFYDVENMFVCWPLSSRTKDDFVFFCDFFDVVVRCGLEQVWFILVAISTQTVDRKEGKNWSIFAVTYICSDTNKAESLRSVCWLRFFYWISVCCRSTKQEQPRNAWEIFSDFRFCAFVCGACDVDIEMFGTCIAWSRTVAEEAKRRKTRREWNEMKFYWKQTKILRSNPILMNRNGPRRMRRRENKAEQKFRVTRPQRFAVYG